MRTGDWVLLGAPWDCSGTRRGEDAAPDALRAAGLSSLVEQDLGDAATVIADVERDERTGVRALADTVRAVHALADVLGGVLRDLPGRRPLVVGGDCSILLGIFRAVRAHRGRAGLCFLDGHPDFQDGRSSDTGETADMDLAVLTGAGAEPLTTLAGAADTPMVAVADVVLLGHRTRDLDEGAAAELARVPAELRRIDAGTVADDPAAAGRLAATWLAGRPVWLHLDVDVLDPAVLPAVTYPQPHGLDWDQIVAAMSPAARSPQLLGVSVADFRPDLDPTGEHARRLVDVLAESLP